MILDKYYFKEYAMFSFLLGLAIGAAFAPFWMGIWNTYIKPMIAKFTAKKP